MVLAKSILYAAGPDRWNIGSRAYSQSKVSLKFTAQKKETALSGNRRSLKLKVEFNPTDSSGLDWMALELGRHRGLPRQFHQPIV